ncbi:hypothetical protein LOTGIDRAFT_231468 [Lottia gigantea]|uniref:Uncharacterized protein n=1 Tax=Lottia gigantea TaxID=225164 RepID=V4AQY6_LOTGI|nr:hypothetical protein LOTGIDRAFT_231468 [Lottia gigantea]ESO97240.1 hypothetical protein LOTGIDRAFT_231468 [Lottia gigantea]
MSVLGDIDAKDVDDIGIDKDLARESFTLSVVHPKVEMIRCRLSTHTIYLKGPDVDIDFVGVRMTSIPTSLNRELDTSPSDHLFFSLVSTIFFLPLGVAAILQGLKVRKALKLNDLPTAEYASARAARFALSGVLLGANMAAIVTFITAEDGASCDQPENGLRTIIDTHLIYVFIMLPQFTMVASIIFIFPDTDEEENIISEGNKSSPEIQPMCTEIKVHSPPEVATIRDCPPCTYATALNNADENLTRSSKHPPYEDVTASHLCSSYDSVTASCHCLSCDGVAASRYCLSCDDVTVSRHSSSFNGVTASPYCQASLNYLTCNTSRLCVSCAYLKLSQFIIFVYLSFVIWGMKPVSILLQEFRCIDRQNIVNGFILLPPFVFSSGIYLLTIFSPLVLSLSHK